MSSISATTSFQRPSPLSLLQDELASEVKAGAIKDADQSALSSALSDIDSAMQSGGPKSGSPPSREDMQSRIGDLIDKQVTDGKLTSDQATELKGVFAKALPAPGAGGPGGPGGPEVSGGSKDSQSTSNDPLTELLQLLQNAVDQSSGYRASGQVGQSQTSALLLDYLS